MTKFLSLGFVLAVITFAPGCISFSQHDEGSACSCSRPTASGAATVYSDGTYVDQPVQPAPVNLRCAFWQPLPKMRPAGSASTD